MQSCGLWRCLLSVSLQGTTFACLAVCEDTLTTGRDAGDTYSKLAEVHVKQDSKTDAAQAYVEASKAYQRVDKSSRLLLNMRQAISSLFKVS